VKVTIAGADVSRYYNGDQFGRTSVQLSAFDLEVGLGTVVIPEIAGTDAFVTGRQCMVEQGTTVLVDGFIASDDRGRLETEPTKPRREWTMSLEDANAITSNIRAIDWTRSSETCTARILARIAADGFSVDTTWVQSTSATLPAKKYKTGDIWSELATDAIERTGWTLFVHDKAGGGRCFHFHSLTTGHACGLSITDVMGAWDNVTSFVPINPRRIRDPADLRSDIILEDQNGRTAHVTDSTSIAAHDADGRRHQEYVQVDADSQADLDLQAARMLLDRKDDITTYECTIGPLDETALGSIRVGDMMTVTSQVFGLTASSQRIANMTLTPLGPTLWTATLELSRPVRHGNKIPGMDGGRDGGGTGGGGNSDPTLSRDCNDCPPVAGEPVQCLFTGYDNGWFIVSHTNDTTSLTSTSLNTTTDDVLVNNGGCDVSVINPVSPGDAYYNALQQSLTISVAFHLSRVNETTGTHDSAVASIGVRSQFNGSFSANAWWQSDGGTPVTLGTFLETALALGPTFTVHQLSTSWANTGFTGDGLLTISISPTGCTASFDGHTLSDSGLSLATETGYIQPGVGLAAFATNPAPLGGIPYTMSAGLLDIRNSGTEPWCTGTPAPTSGQAVTNEPAPSGDGATTTFSTQHPYMPGSLFVKVNGVNWTGDIASQDPTTGSFTFTHAPKAGADIVVDYRAA
jgi:hypothetical protein